MLCRVALSWYETWPMKIDTLLKETILNQASDLHLSAGMRPMMRIDGELVPMDSAVLSPDPLKVALLDMMDDVEKQALKVDLEHDFSCQIPGVARFRVNVFHQLYGLGAVFRVIPDKAVTLASIDAPEVFKSICQKPHGLVLITGPTGSGKSTTMSAMINHINTHQSKHIITIENPIEFIHKSQQCLINQRQVGKDTQSFPMALRSALREDPDIILVGEMRDIESMRLAMTAAETGHLVISTLHTNSAPETINRVINVFPAKEQNLIRGMLSVSLQAVISQTLLKKRAGGRVAAYEIMLCNTAIRNLIHENKIAQIVSCIQTGQSEGMATRGQYITLLERSGVL